MSLVEVKRPIRLLLPLFTVLGLTFVLTSCGDQEDRPNREPRTSLSIKAVDISSYPEINTSNVPYFNKNGEEESLLNILHESGINTIRLRLWVDPIDGRSTLKEVSNFSSILKSYGFQIWLAPHLSDTWADPGAQAIPERWINLDETTTIDSLSQYFMMLMESIDPDIIQIGNEINSGLLHPLGHISSNEETLIRIIESSVDAIRSKNKNTKIMLHYAGYEEADWFYDHFKSIDYDMIGLSYYPLWHGKSIDELAATVNALGDKYQKEVVIAETAYPWTLEWNDLTHNVVGMEEQLILPEYPASASGQYQFVQDLYSLLLSLEHVSGLCYWGAELIAWKGNQSTSGSSWENQALFDFNHQVLPAMDVFNEQ